MQQQSAASAGQARSRSPLVAVSDETEMMSRSASVRSRSARVPFRPNMAELAGRVLKLDVGTILTETSIVDKYQKLMGISSSSSTLRSHNTASSDTSASVAAPATKKEVGVHFAETDLSKFASSSTASTKGPHLTVSGGGVATAHSSTTPIKERSTAAFAIDVDEVMNDNDSQFGAESVKSASTVGALSEATSEKEYVKRRRSSAMKLELALFNAVSATDDGVIDFDSFFKLLQDHELTADISEVKIRRREGRVG